MADTSLIWNIIARDRTSAVLKKLESRTASLGKAVGVALGPAIVPMAAAGTAAVFSLGAALAGAGVAGGVFGAVTKSAMGDVTEAATKVEDLTDKIDLYKQEARLAAAAGEDNTKYVKKQAEATLELRARLANLPPATRAATMGYLDMKETWKGFVEQNKPAVFNFMANGYKVLGQEIGNLQPFFDMGISAANRMSGAIQGWFRGGGLQRLAATAAPALRTLTSIVLNTGRAIGGMFGQIGAAQGQGILEWIERMTQRWAEWATATERGTGIQKFIDYVRTNGPAVASTLASLAAAAIHIAQATAPLAPISLAIAQGLSAVISAIPPSVLTALVAGFILFNTAMRIYAIGTAIAAAAQWAMNSALLASPVTWIILGIVALIAAIVLIATKTDWFQRIWRAVWGTAKTAFLVAKAGVTAGINAIINTFNMWRDRVAAVIKLIVSKVVSVVNAVRNAKNSVAGALSSFFTPMWNGFRSMVNRIIGGWNRLSFGIPGFSFAGISVPGIRVNTPDIPYLAVGGHVQQSGLAMIHRGETVTPAARVTPYRSGSGGDGATLTIKGDGSRTSNFLLELLREAIREKGGDVVKVLTPR